MPGPLILIAALVLAGVVVGVVFFLAAMRARSPLALRTMIWFTRRVMNPTQMRTAGQPGAYASVIRHRGRRSGQAYETPVGVVAAADGFLIALPYGTHANWLRNVLAAGSATLVTEGHTYEVDQPELIPMDDVVDRFPPGDQRSFRVFGVDRALRLHRRVEVAA